MSDNKRFQGDIELLNKIGPDQAAAFEKFMSDLDAEHAKRGTPYGSGSLWQNTGAECWYSFFEDGMSPSDALDEDMSASYD